MPHDIVVLCKAFIADNLSYVDIGQTEDTADCDGCNSAGGCGYRSCGNLGNGVDSDTDGVILAVYAFVNELNDGAVLCRSCSNRSVDSCDCNIVVNLIAVEVSINDFKIGSDVGIVADEGCLCSVGKN